MPLSDHLTELRLLQGSDGNPPPKSLDLLAAHGNHAGVYDSLEDTPRIKCPAEGGGCDPTCSKPPQNEMTQLQKSEY